MNFPADHIERIKEFGYTESEARFLYIVAVHSGYFTLGQFRAFTGTAYGKRPTSFGQKVLKFGHASIRDYMRRGSLFHLFSRTIYGQIEKDNLRNRKRHSFDFMRSRLVLLDFILANQDLNYFETEQDKFSRTIYGQIEKDNLRNRKRHSFDFETSSHFVSHLGAYQGLFRHLKSFRFLYIAAKDAYFQKAEERFRSLVKRPLESDVSGELLRYFQVRRKWERHEYVVPVTEDLEFLNEARRRFHGDRFEGFYQDWSTGTVTERDLRLEFSQLKHDRPVFFGTFLVQEHSSPVVEIIFRGDGCVKDTRNPTRHRSRHPGGDAKLLGA